MGNFLSKRFSKKPKPYPFQTPTVPFGAYSSNYATAPYPTFGYPQQQVQVQAAAVPYPTIQQGYPATNYAPINYQGGQAPAVGAGGFIPPVVNPNNPANGTASNPKWKQQAQSQGLGVTVPNPPNGVLYSNVQGNPVIQPMPQPQINQPPPIVPYPTAQPYTSTTQPFSGSAQPYTGASFQSFPNTSSQPVTGASSQPFMSASSQPFTSTTQTYTATTNPPFSSSTTTTAQNTSQGFIPTSILRQPSEPQAPPPLFTPNTTMNNLNNFPSSFISSSQPQPQPPPPPQQQEPRDFDQPAFIPPSRPNPLPAPPRDIYDTTPYRALLNLPQTTALLTSTYSHSRGASEGGASEKEKGKGKGKGLFHSLSSRRKRASEGNASARGPLPGGFIPAIIVPSQPQSVSATDTPTTQHTATPLTSQTSNQPLNGVGFGGNPATTTTPPSSPPTVRFTHQGALSGFMNHSPHRVLYQNTTYPSALHLHEAMKFLGSGSGYRPDLAEQIRGCAGVQDVYPLSARLGEFVRSDWGAVFLKCMEDVLYLKFRQHPDLRHMLMNTGMSKLIYAEANDPFWGEGGNKQGGNELGKALVRIRDRLREEGYGL